MDHTYSIFTKSTSREGEKALSYITVCGPCEDQYRQRGNIFDNEQDGFEWLRKEQW
jgi:hypothetical protein